MAGVGVNANETIFGNDLDQHIGTRVLFFLVLACPESPILASLVMVVVSFGDQYIECTLILYYFMHFFTTNLGSGLTLPRSH